MGNSPLIAQQKPALNLSLVNVYILGAAYAIQVVICRKQVQTQFKRAVETLVFNRKMPSDRKRSVITVL